VSFLSPPIGFLKITETGDFHFASQSSIGHLFRSCRPSHVAGFVMTVVFDPIKHVFRRRFWSDAFEELREGLEKKFDSALCVVSAERMILFASAFGIPKRFIFTTHLSANGMTVAEIKRRNLLGSEWSAPDWHATILQGKGA